MKGLANVRRSDFVIAFSLLAAAAPAAAAPAHKVLVIGIDGLDPKLLRRYADEGHLPHFKKLMEEGDFKPLQTSMPPMSPVAWSTFITGMDPGGHGIYDFIHRDPATRMPFLSMSRAEPPSRTLTLGSWVFPLAGGRVENLRKGEAFWQYLEEDGVPTTIYKMPANFPPASSKGRALSGMGTPDILGTSSTFSYYSNRPVPNAKEITGGKAYVVSVRDGRVDAKLYGPKNTFRRFAKPTTGFGAKRPTEYRNPDLTVDFSVYLDPEKPVAKFVVQDNEFILEEGEWSPWISVRFDAVPLLASVSAIGRFYLKQARPDFKLYVTSLQINPEDPAMPISTPGGWSHELWEELGYFHTKELPEDTKAFTYGILTGEEFWQQSQSIFHETRRAFDYLLDRFEEGLLFVYFSSVDQGCHMLWRYMDPGHPAYVEDDKLKDAIRTLYEEMDEVAGRAMEAVDDDTTLVIMSDHGFGPFGIGVNLNTWLLEKGYVRLRNPALQENQPLFANVDWGGTRAYALGLNGLYVNLKGREDKGIVRPGEEYERLLDQLEKDLLEMRDPSNGNPVVTLVTRTHRDFHGPHLDLGPDLIVGYNWDYRSSWKSPLGEFPKGVIVRNDEPWSGDHLGDYRLVPGVLLTNRRITLETPALYDLTVAILDEYGIEKPAEMIGKDCLGPRPASRN